MNPNHKSCMDCVNLNRETDMKARIQRFKCSLHPDRKISVPMVELMVNGETVADNCEDYGEEPAGGKTSEVRGGRG